MQQDTEERAWKFPALARSWLILAQEVPAPAPTEDRIVGDHKQKDEIEVKMGLPSVLLILPEKRVRKVSREVLLTR